MTHYVDDRVVPGNNDGNIKDEDEHNTNERIAVLTYREGVILVFEAHSLRLLRTIDTWPSPTTTGEGWGIAFDPVHKVFVVTDGSEFLHFWNLDFEEIPPPWSSAAAAGSADAEDADANAAGGGRKLAVRIEELVVPPPDGSGEAASRVLIPRRDNARENEEKHGIGLPGSLVGHLNELEWDASTHTLLANKWFEEVVLRIDPTTGLVLRVYDFSRLYPPGDRHRITTSTTEGYSREDVFNGIAVLPNTDGKEWLLTGKYWPYMYRIRIKE
jgi:glutamine cyclotransferase